MSDNSARDRNREINLAEYRTGADVLASNPQYVAIELTQGCNLACPMCRSQRLGLKGRSMRPELFDRIADELFETAALVDLRGWGESLILPDIKKYVRRTADSGAEIRFVTNLAMKKAPIEMLAEHACHVMVSVDAADPAVYANIRKGASWAKFVDNLSQLARAYQARRLDGRLVLGVTVTAPGAASLPSLVAFAASVGINELRLFSVAVENHSSLSLEADPASVDEAIKSATEMAAKHGVRLVAGTRFGSMPEREVGGAACLHPWSYAFFAYDGSVGFCDHLVGEHGKEFFVGTLDASSFRDIWNGAEWIALRKEHLGARREKASKFKECAWCYKHRYTDFEMMFDPSALQHCLAGSRQAPTS